MNRTVTRQPIWRLRAVFFCALNFFCALSIATLGIPAATVLAQSSAPTPDHQAEASAAGGSDTSGSKVKWTPLVEKWKACEFGGDGPVEINKKRIEVGYGDPLTGVRWTDSFPKNNYQVELEAKRTDGFDFFCALTFPVAETHCTLVLGGWGGGVTGLSNVDGYDASDNPTTQFQAYADDKWYRVRVRVDDKAITCWVDDKQIIQQERNGHEFGIRYEMDPCVPLGIAAFQCGAEYRRMRWHPLGDQKAENDSKSTDTSDQKADSVGENTKASSK